MKLRATDTMGWNFPHGTPHPRSAYGRIGGLGALGQDWDSWGSVDDWGAPVSGATGDYQTGVQLPSAFYGWGNWSQVPGDVGSPVASSGFSDLDATLNSVIKLAQAGLIWDAQRRMVDLNIERAKRGLAPIDSSQISPQLGVKVGVSPQMQQTLLFGAIALGAVFLLGGRRRK